MANFDKGRVDRHRDERIIVSRIEGDRKEKAPYHHLPSNEKRMLSATFFSYLKKLFQTFSSSRELGGHIVDRMAIVENLRAFQQHLARLKIEDISQSPQFAIKLSTLWHQILDDFDLVMIMERKELKKSSGFRALVEAIRHYPEGADHPLGYYLMEQAGKDWLPFPFIDQLATLYNEHQETPDSSTLSKWDHLFEEVIESLKGMHLFETKEKGEPK